MSERTAGVERVADHNLRNWAMAENARARLTKRKAQETVGPYLAISRELGTGGGEIASLVAQSLDWEVMDREIIDYMVEKYGTPRELVNYFDEKHTSWLEEVFDSWIKGQRFTESTYVHRLTRLLLLAANHGKVVIVGRGAAFLLPRSRGLSVRIVAPLDYRIEQVKRMRDATEKDARRLIEDSDRQRAEFIKSHFHHDACNVHEYDLVVNVEKIDPSDAVDLITTTVKTWLQKQGAETLVHDAQ
ncbi:MAG: cytidylate kinase-like family protein [Planctomycetales bacterium]|nr:cytidylate kinase-like family protein [Planctomycetales bacterium]